MCIRDRTEPDQGGAELVTGLRGMDAGRRRQRPQRLGEDRPVSYTHLRAHETVLEIVCRLLLEKK